MRLIILTLILTFTILSVSYAQSELTVLRDINYIDVIDGTKHLNVSIFIQNSIIVKIGNHEIPKDARVIECKGKWAMPGMVDAHIHLFQSGGLYTRPDVIELQKYKAYPEERQWLIDNTEDLLRRYLRCGITSVIDMGGPFYDFDLRDKYNDSKNYPNLFITGPLISTYQPDAFKIEDAPILKVKTKEEVLDIIERQLPYKTDFIKIWYIARYDETAKQNFEIIKATVDRSHELGLKAAVHATELATAKLALKAGADILVHSVDDPIDDEFIRLARANNAIVIPTLIVHRKYIDVFLREMETTAEDFLYANPVTLGSLYDLNHIGNYGEFIKRKAFTPEGKRMWFDQDKVRKNNLKRMISEGITIATGTDAGNIGTLHGSSFFEELKYMSDAGMSNSEIMRASTINGARVLNKDKNLGSIVVGKNADLLVLNSNPLDDINACKDIKLVIKGGNIMPVDSIIRTSPEYLARQQVNGYNALNIDAFLEPYSEDCCIYTLEGELLMKGKEAMRKGYSALFGQSPNLHCVIENRIVQQNTVIDQERVTGLRGADNVRVIAVYKIEKNKIAKVYFIRWEE